MAQESTSTFSEKPKISSSPLITPLDPIALDKAILESHNQLKFNSTEWKHSIDKRQRMLVDFYKQHLLSKTLDQINALIGEPFPFKDTVDHHLPKMTNNTNNEFYELSTFQDRRIFLNIFFLNNHVYGLRIGQMLLPNSLNVFSTDWHWANPNNSDIAKELNRHFHIVGAPTKHLCQIIGHPKNEGNYWTCGAIQLEYTPDQNTVKRFRVVASKNNGLIHHSTKWETKNLRINKGSYSTSRDLQDLSSQRDELFIKPYNNFDRAQWAAYHWRDFMLFDLTHSYSLIGSTRKNIRNLLGEPTFTEESKAREKLQQYLDQRLHTPLPTNKFDWYSLHENPVASMSHNQLAPNELSESLELVYKNDKVAGYRIINSKFYNQEHSKSQLGGDVSAIKGGPVAPLTD